MNESTILGERARITNSFDDLAQYKYCRLTTFKRSGDPVPTPMWFAVDGTRLYMKTEVPSGKVRRIRNDSRVEVAPCTVMGRSLGTSVGGRARLLSPDEESRAERALRRRYGFGRWLFGRVVEPIFHARGSVSVYVEVVPAEGRP